MPPGTVMVQSRCQESGAFKEVPADQTRETLAEKEKKIEQRTKCSWDIRMHLGHLRMQKHQTHTEKNILL